MKINKTKCDQCGEERDTLPGSQQYGGWQVPMIQVPLLVITDVPTRPAPLINRVAMDFCNEKCLLAYLMAHYPPNNKIQP